MTSNILKNSDYQTPKKLLKRLALTCPKILTHSFHNESQILKIKYKDTIKYIKLNLIGKIQIKNILMALIAAKKSGLNLSYVNTY